MQWKEIYHPQEYGFVSLEDTLWDSRENHVVDGIGSGCLSSRGSVRGGREYDPHLAMSLWNAGEEIARAIYGRVGAIQVQLDEL